MRSTLLTWCLLAGLLLQWLAWSVPDHPTGLAERWAHQLTHAIDHGHHAHDGTERDRYAALDTHETRGDDNHGPHHAHVLDNAPWCSLPPANPRAPQLPAGSGPALEPVASIATVHLQGPLRPPQPLI